MRQWSHSDLSLIANAPPAGTHFVTDFFRPMGCVRSDQINTVIFAGQDGHIHQLNLSGGTWVHADLSVLADAVDASILAKASPMGCVRPDNVFSVVYTGRRQHIHALQVIGNEASHVDLTALAGAPEAASIGPPTHFVRGDGIAVVVYTDLGGPTSSVRQLALTNGNWVHSNLSELTHSPINGLIKTTGYVRHDQTTSVIFVSGGITELALPPNGQWTSTDLLSSVHAPSPNPLRWPMGFIKSDGTASVVYADQNSFIHELAFVEGKWTATALSETANAPRLTAAGGPMGYIRGDGITAVVYCGSDNHIHELTLIEGRWLHSDLSLAANSTDTFGYPFAYVRSDRFSSIIYQGADAHIHELALPPA